MADPTDPKNLHSASRGESGFYVSVKVPNTGTRGRTPEIVVAISGNKDGVVVIQDADGKLHHMDAAKSLDHLLEVADKKAREYVQRADNRDENPEA